MDETKFRGELTLRTLAMPADTNAQWGYLWRMAGITNGFGCRDSGQNLC